MKKLFFVLSITIFNIFSFSQNYNWLKDVSGPGNEICHSLKIDIKGHIYSAGTFTKSIDLDPGSGTEILICKGDQDIFISKLDSNGNFIWAKSLEGSPKSNIPWASLETDKEGNIYLTGTFSGTFDFDPGEGIYNLSSIGWFDLFILKLDRSGNFIWVKRMGGKEGYVSGQAICLDAAGNIYTSGRFSQTVDFDPGTGIYNLSCSANPDIFISKLDSSGNFIWTKKMGGTEYDMANSISVDNKGNIYTSGIFGISPDGKTVQSDFDPGTGTFYLMASFLQRTFISKLDTNGNFIWAKKTDGSDNHPKTVIDKSGDFFVGTGSSFISKFNASGEQQWTRKVGKVDISDIKLDSKGNSYIAGSFSDSLVIIGNTTFFNPSRTGHFFIAKYNLTGDIQWVASADGSDGNNRGATIALGLHNTLFTAGNFAGFSITFNGTTLINDDSTGNSNDIFLLKVNNPEPLKIIEEVKSIHSISIFPNPCSRQFKILSPDIIEEVLVSNALGQFIYEAKPKTQEVMIDIKNEGIYFVSIKTASQTRVRKLLVER